MMKADYVYGIAETSKFDFKIGIVLSLEPKNDQMHCGLAFDLENQKQVIHLASHNDLRCDDGLNSFKCIIKPNLAPIVQESFISLCDVIKEGIKRGNNQVPYGFLYDNYAIIENDGTLNLTEKEVGLTCATYVLTIFHSCGFNLVDISDWPPRDEDAPWYKKIIDLYSRFQKVIGISSEHIEKLKLQMNVPRFRPEEVSVSSALYSGGPAPTVKVWEDGAALKKYLYQII